MVVRDGRDGPDEGSSERLFLGFLSGFFRVSFRGTVGLGWLVRSGWSGWVGALYHRFRSSRADPTHLDSDPTTPIQSAPKPWYPFVHPKLVGICWELFGSHIGFNLQLRVVPGRARVPRFPQEGRQQLCQNREPPALRPLHDAWRRCFSIHPRNRKWLKIC